MSDRPDTETKNQEPNAFLPQPCSDTDPLWTHMHEEHGLLLLNGEIEDIVNIVTPIIESRQKQASKERYLKAKAAMQEDDYFDGVDYFLSPNAPLIHAPENQTETKR